MKAMRRLLAGLLVAAFLYGLWLFQFWYQTPGGPHLVSANGVWRVENCSDPSADDWKQCVELSCEAEARNRQLLSRADRSIVSYMHWRANTPQSSTVAVKKESDKDIHVVQCKLERLQVVAVKTITTREFDEAGAQ